MIRSNLSKMRLVLLRRVKGLKRRTEKPLLISSRFIWMFLFIFFIFNSWENNIYSYRRPLFFRLLDVNAPPSWAFYLLSLYLSLTFLFIYLQFFFFFFFLLWAVSYLWDVCLPVHLGTSFYVMMHSSPWGSNEFWGYLGVLVHYGLGALRVSMELACPPKDLVMSPSS